MSSWFFGLPQGEVLLAQIKSLCKILKIHTGIFVMLVKMGAVNTFKFPNYFLGIPKMTTTMIDIYVFIYI